MDPAEFRRINFRTDARGGPVTPAGIQAGGLSHEVCLDRLLELMKYKDLRKLQASERQRGRHLGIGLSAFIVYSTWAAFQGDHYTVPGTSYLSPFYSPELFSPKDHKIDTPTA